MMLSDNASSPDTDGVFVLCKGVESMGRRKKNAPYEWVNMGDQHEKNRIRAQMEADAYWKMKREEEAEAAFHAAPFNPFTFSWKISRYAQKLHRKPSHRVNMSTYGKELLRQGMAIKAKVKYLKGVGK